MNSMCRVDFWDFLTDPLTPLSDPELILYSNEAEAPASAILPLMGTKRMEWLKAIEMARPWYLGQALRIAPCLLLDQNRASHHINLQCGKPCPLHLASNTAHSSGREDGKKVPSLWLPKGSHWRNEGSVFPSSFFISSAPYRCVPSHMAQSPLSSSEPLQRKLETGYAASPLCFAPSPQVNAGIWERETGSLSSVLPDFSLSLSFIFFFLSP